MQFPGSHDPVTEIAAIVRTHDPRYDFSVKEAALTKPSLAEKVDALSGAQRDLLEQAVGNHYALRRRMSPRT